MIMTDTQSRTVWPAEASTAQLVSQMSEQVSTLVRDELALARVEMVEKGKRAGTGAGLLGGAGVLAMYGVGALLVTIGAALATAACPTNGSAPGGGDPFRCGAGPPA